MTLSDDQLADLAKGIAAGEWAYDTDVKVHGIPMRPAVKRGDKIALWVDKVNVEPKAIVDQLNLTGQLLAEVIALRKVLRRIASNGSTEENARMLQQIAKETLS
jgi:hypothetical protein